MKDGAIKEYGLHLTDSQRMARVRKFVMRKRKEKHHKFFEITLVLEWSAYGRYCCSFYHSRYFKILPGKCCP